jgi:hypothetical protein
MHPSGLYLFRTYFLRRLIIDQTEIFDARKLVLVLLSRRQGGQGDALRYQKMLERNASNMAVVGRHAAHVELQFFCVH